MQKLLSARFWVTMLLTVAFCYLSLRGLVKAEVFIPVYIVVINYYFTRKRKEE